MSFFFFPSFNRFLLQYILLKPVNFSLTDQVSKFTYSQNFFVNMFSRQQAIHSETGVGLLDKICKIYYKKSLKCCFQFPIKKKKKSKSRKFFKFQLETQFIFKICLILLFLSILLFSCRLSFLTLSVDIYNLQMEFFCWVSLSLPGWVSALQTGLSVENSR